MSPLDLQLQPGDLLLYKQVSFAKSKFGWLVGWFIRIKTGSFYSHCEVYKGGNVSMASRDGIGVDMFTFREAELAKVRRPIAAYQHAAGKAWFETVRGQKYDFIGLLCFYWAAWRGGRDKMFCSEFAARLYRAGGLQIINKGLDADKVSPNTLDQSIEFEDVWQA